MTNRTRSLRHLGVGFVAAMTLVGCSSADKPRPLQSNSFYTPGQPHGQVGDPSTELNRQNAVGEVRIPANPNEPPPVPASQIQQDPPGPKLPERQLAPATRPVLPGSSSGQYQLMGAVVAKVNGSPIYSNKVLNLIDKPLRSKAKLEREQFREYAAGLIQQQVGELINDELLYAAAVRGLSEEDQKVADAVTQNWRVQQITQAGGSVEVARSRAAADGDDFDDLVHQQYRRTMIDYYRQKKLYPRIRVSADDLRKYYAKHLQDEFTTQQAVKFRLLAVDVAGSGGRDKAMSKVAAKLERAKKGEDFATICTKENDSPTLASNAGTLGWKAPGTLPQKKLETAIWALKPSDYTGIVDMDDTLYVARLEEIRTGGSRAFDEQTRADGNPTVQEEIRSKLQREQFRVLSNDIENRLRSEALVETNNQQMNLVLDMAMQKYYAWMAMAQ